ncbi:primosomal protein N' [Anaplasma platys]|uniref:Replication restart protein PriA n=2 Tax=Anaplasma platys TaxID=949 RepID=A0A858PXV6_9RICK|nr:primosomal protein N' [Anaplasma platys]
MVFPILRHGSVSGKDGVSMIAEVVLPVPLDRAFYYLVRDDTNVSVGDYVSVPFGSRMAVGLVMQLQESVELEIELKYIQNRLDLPPIGAEFIGFIQWMSSYNIIPMGTVLKMVLGGMPSAKLLSKTRERLQGGGSTEERPSNHQLSEEQSTACAKILELSTGFNITVLDGKTGSGKTEVYCAAIRKLLLKSPGAQILILLPEIVLATQLMKRVFEHFSGHNPVEWHSGLTPKKRRENWLAVAYGAASIIVGARSALFLPYRDLKMIIVDEEHESSYKQDSGMVYNARDMAIVLAKAVKIPVVLCTATPALETMYNVEQGKYHHVVLQRRFGEAVMPDIIVADMRNTELKNAWLSTELYEKISSTIAKGHQAMLFLNRRGYARLVLCKKCGYKVNCPHCSTWLTEHRILGSLICHYCGHSRAILRQCPECLEDSTMNPYGVGIERIAEGIEELIPGVRTAILSSDIGTKEANRVIELILAGEVDIIIGTQIIAKGHNFPKLTLVGVVDADLGLGNSDLRAAEKTYQLLHQVAGRSGRYKEKGQVVLQTYDPESSVIKSLISSNREDFYAEELKSRKIADMPPYVRLVSIVISGKEENKVVNVAHEIARYLSNSVTVWGPAPAPISLVNNMYRYRILLKVPKMSAVRGLLSICREKYKKLPTVRVVIDVDPINFI